MHTYYEEFEYTQYPNKKETDFIHEMIVKQSGKVYHIGGGVLYLVVTNQSHYGLRTCEDVTHLFSIQSQSSANSG